uniref:Uncharacterized protein n=1 Tax=Siphoviridae sp. ctmpG14 TaxID=2825654 RepID=A0A8S5PAV8_9CAUD|nr:MAG TPA: hypothetical protein [Siphoviridae sp. ctmpG14]
MAGVINVFNSNILNNLIHSQGIKLFLSLEIDF